MYVNGVKNKSPFVPVVVSDFVRSVHALWLYSGKGGLPRCKNVRNFFFVLLARDRVRLLFDVFFALLFSFVLSHP